MEEEEDELIFRANPHPPVTHSLPHTSHNSDILPPHTTSDSAISFASYSDPLVTPSATSSSARTSYVFSRPLTTASIPSTSTTSAYASGFGFLGSSSSASIPGHNYYGFASSSTTNDVMIRAINTLTSSVNTMREQQGHVIRTLQNFSSEQTALRAHHANLNQHLLQRLDTCHDNIDVLRQSINSTAPRPVPTRNTGSDPIPQPPPNHHAAATPLIIQPNSTPSSSAPPPPPVTPIHPNSMPYFMNNPPPNLHPVPQHPHSSFSTPQFPLIPLQPNPPAPPAPPAPPINEHLNRILIPGNSRPPSIRLKSSDIPIPKYSWEHGKRKRHSNSFWNWRNINPSWATHMTKSCNRLSH